MKVLVKPALLKVTMLLLIASLADSLPKRSATDVRDMGHFVGNQDEADRDDSEVSYQKQYEPRVHPCSNTTANRTVLTPEGKKVLCLVPTERELIKELEGIGGYNRHYVAVTEEQARKDFENPFNQTKPEPNNWKSNFTGRRRRSLDEKEYNSASEEDHGRAKRALPVGLQECRHKGERSSLGLVHLCTECWWIQKLPDDKFPRFINEKICGEDGNSFSTFSDEFCEGRSDGFCLQQSFTQDLLMNTNRYVQIPSPDAQYSVVYKQVWEPYGQEIRSCCQCQNM